VTDNSFVNNAGKTPSVEHGGSHDIAGDLALYFLNRVHNLAAVIRNGHIVLVNPEGAKILGYETPGEVSGRLLEEFIMPASMDTLRDVWTDAPEEPEPLALTIARADKTKISLDAWITPISFGGLSAYLLEGRVRET